MIRRIGCVITVAIIWVVIFGWAGAVGWDTPLFPQDRNQLAASAFHVVFGAGVEDGEALRVAAVGDDGNALQSIALGHVDADAFPILRYRFEDFPRTLELSLIFRRAGAEDVQSITVPWPGDGWTTLDLRNVPGWHGDIVELGFAEYATPQVVPPSVAFKPFRFDEAELWSPSWRGSLAALSTSWFGYTPWALLSVSALGQQIDTAKTPPLMPFAVLGCALSVIAAGLILRWPRRRFVNRAAVVALALWIFLDGGWLLDLQAKHALTENLYAGKSWEERMRLVPDQDTATAAEQIRIYLATQPAAGRIIVWSDSSYILLRLLYLLLPLNVAPWSQVAGMPVPAGTLFLLHGSKALHYDDDRHMLIGNRVRLSATPLYESADTHLYRVDAKR